MAQPITTKWTVVILGKWNQAILQPEWLIKNVFDDDQVRVEVAVGLAPGLPSRITGDEILLLAGEDRLILGLTEVSDDQLRTMERIAVQILTLLSHTPVARMGVNFGFSSAVSTTWTTEHLPNTFVTRILEADLTPTGRSCKWSFKHGDTDNDNLNVDCNLSGDNIDVKFNFDFETPTVDIAKDKIEGKLFEYRNLAISLLGTLFDLEVDSE